VDECCDVGDPIGLSLGRDDHQRAIESAHDALEGVLVRVVPVGAHLIGDEPVHEGFTWRDGVLRHARHPVIAGRDVIAVPVQGHPVFDVAIRERDLDELALRDDELRAGDRSERDGVVVGSVGQRDRLVTCLELIAVDGKPVAVGLAQIRDRDRRSGTRIHRRQVMSTCRGSGDRRSEDREEREQCNRETREGGRRDDHPSPASCSGEQGDRRG
jgi:hypothetical protein